MGDSNNHRAGSLPVTPAESLRRLEPLVGRWDITGSLVEGTCSFEWMTGGHFLVQHVNLSHHDRLINGIEYIGFDEDTHTLRSHFMDSNGSNFTYTWDVDGHDIYTWFGEKGSANWFHGKLSADLNRYDGAWQWPDGQGGTGGYTATAVRARG